MLSQVTDRRTATTDALARRRLELVAAEYVVRMGRRIAQAREEAGMSQNDLARELPGKVGAQMVSKWERGLHEPRSDTLEAIARVLNRSIAYFMADEPQEGTPNLLEVLNGDGDRLDEAISQLKLLVERQVLVERAVEGLAREIAELRRQRPQGQQRAS
jgi:transcriptional regulator with XRE-family HTH domain